MYVKFTYSIIHLSESPNRSLLYSKVTTGFWLFNYKNMYNSESFQENSKFNVIAQRLFYFYDLAFKSQELVCSLTILRWYNDYMTLKIYSK